MIRQRRCLSAIAIGAATLGPASCTPAPAPRDAAVETATVTSASGVAPATPRAVRAPARGQVGVGVWGAKLMLARPWSLVDEGAVQRCYDEVRASDPAAAGWVLFRLTVSASGNVTVEVAEREGVPETLAACTARAITATTDPPETSQARRDLRPVPVTLLSVCTTAVQIKQRRGVFRRPRRGPKSTPLTPPGRLQRATRGRDNVPWRLA